MLNTNIKLYIEMKGFYEKNADVIIELPRQLLKVHGVGENATCSLLELALRKVYTERYNFPFFNDRRATLALSSIL